MNTREMLPTVAVALLGLLAAAQGTGPSVQQALSDRDALQQDITTLQGTVQALPTETARHTQLQADYEALKSSLPEAEKLPLVLKTLSDTAHLLNVSTGRIERNVRASTLPGVTAVDLSLSLSGTYARTQAYVQTLARLPRAYTAQGINLSANDKTGLVTGTLKLTTYTRDSKFVDQSVTPPSTPASLPGPAGTQNPASGTTGAVPPTTSPSSIASTTSPSGTSPTSPATIKPLSPGGSP